METTRGGFLKMLGGLGAALVSIPHLKVEEKPKEVSRPIRLHTVSAPAGKNYTDTFSVTGSNCCTVGVWVDTSNYTLKSFRDGKWV